LEGLVYLPAFFCIIWIFFTAEGAEGAE